MSETTADNKKSVGKSPLNTGIAAEAQNEMKPKEALHKCFYSSRLETPKEIAKCNEDDACTIITVNNSGMIAQVMDARDVKQIGNSFMDISQLELKYMILPEPVDSIRKKVVLGETYLIHEDNVRFNTTDRLFSRELAEQGLVLNPKTLSLDNIILTDQQLLNISKTERLEQYYSDIEKYKMDETNVQVKVGDKTLNIQNRSKIRNVFSQSMILDNFVFLDSNGGSWNLTGEQAKTIFKKLSETANTNYVIHTENITKISKTKTMKELESLELAKPIKLSFEV